MTISESLLELRKGPIVLGLLVVLLLSNNYL
jgi:hypothetical protein